MIGLALERAHACLAARADCVFPIAIWERDALSSFIRDAVVRSTFS